jgi:putative Mn2+ efflux pump MntP
MTLIELLLLALGLSMDAVAVAICKGLSMQKINLKHALTVGAWFGGFQALMPLVGYLLGTAFAGYIRTFSNWIAFILLAAIGLNMIREAFAKKKAKSAGEEAECESALSVKAMFLLAIATSIDALAVGVTFAFLQVSIVPAILTIGLMTFLLSAAGVKLGSVFGAKFEATAEVIGGTILCLLGIKILLERFGIYFG